MDAGADRDNRLGESHAASLSAESNRRIALLQKQAIVLQIEAVADEFRKQKESYLRELRS